MSQGCIIHLFCCKTICCAANIGLADLQRTVRKQMKYVKNMPIKGGKHYLEAENTANEEQHNEDQAHVAESSDLLFVGEVIRLHGSQKNRWSREFI